MSGNGSVVERVAADAADAADRALLKRVARGDRPAFDALYRQYFGKISRFLGRITRRQELVEETANETLWVVWRKAGDFQGASAVSTWIFGIAYRCTLRSLRDNGPDEAAAVPDNAPDAFAAEELSDWIERGLGMLSVEQRAALELAYYHGYSCEEIAAVMSCAVGTVKARMSRARVHLRNVLPALGGDHAQEVLP